jgi:nicotinamide riboside kinase
MKNTIHINLWAGPSTGKSGVSGKLFGKMKENSIDCELVREVAKDFVWDGSLKNIEQVVITTKQYEREAQLHGKVDFLIVDTSILMGILYCNENYKEQLLHIMKHLIKDWKIINYFLERDLTKRYETNGRLQNFQESIKKDFEIKKFLKDQGIDFKQIPVQEATEKIYNELIKK